MDNGAIFYVFVLGPMLPLVFVLAAVVVFGAGYVVHALIGAVIGSFVELSRPRRERAYVKKHQRGISHL